MGFLAFDGCFFETAEDEALKIRKKGGRGKERERSKEDGDGGCEVFLGTRQSNFCRFHPRVYKRVKMHPNPTLNRIILL